MDGISGVSAVLGIVQVGFSLAQAIRDTVKDYKEAEDDLKKLARDIDRTLYVVSRLETLISESDNNGSFDSGGLEVMRECHKHTEQIVEALIALLTNTGVSYKPTKEIKPSDLIISRSNRVSWLGRKADVKEKQEELKDIYLEVNTIINLRDAIQATPGAERAAKRAMAVESERRRRKRVQLRQNMRKDSTQPQRKPSVPTGGNLAGDPLISTAASPTQAHHPSGERKPSVSGDQLKGLRWNLESKDSVRDDVAKEDRRYGNVNFNNSAKDTKLNNNTSNSKDDDCKKTGNDPLTCDNDMILELERNFFEQEHHPKSPDYQQISHEAVIENFKRETKDTIIALANEAQEALKRTTPFARYDTPEWRLRRFIESEYVQKWTAEFGEWLPGTRLDLRTSLDTPRADMQFVKLHKWSLRKNHDTSPSSTLQRLGIPDRAHFLVTEQPGNDKRRSVTRLSPPRGHRSADMRATARIWTGLNDRTKTEIWKSLLSQFSLPQWYQWSLYDVRYTAPPSLMSRLLAHVSAEYTHSNMSDNGCIVTFAATYRYEGEHVSSEESEERKKDKGRVAKTGLFESASVPNAPNVQKPFGNVQRFGWHPSNDDLMQARDSLRSFDERSSNTFHGFPRPSYPVETHALQPDPGGVVAEPSGLFGSAAYRPSHLFGSAAYRPDPVQPDKQNVTAPRPARLRRRESSFDPLRLRLEFEKKDIARLNAARKVAVDGRAQQRPVGGEVSQEIQSLASNIPTKPSERQYRDDHTTVSQGHQSHRRSPASSSQGDEADPQDLSDDSVDDAELFNQLLRKYTGHSVRNTTYADDGSHEHDEDGANHSGLEDIGHGDTEHGNSNEDQGKNS